MAAVLRCTAGLQAVWWVRANCQEGRGGQVFNLYGGRGGRGAAPLGSRSVLLPIPITVSNCDSPVPFESLPRF